MHRELVNCTAEQSVVCVTTACNASWLSATCAVLSITICCTLHPLVQIIYQINHVKSAKIHCHVSYLGQIQTHSYIAWMHEGDDCIEWQIETKMCADNQTTSAQIVMVSYKVCMQCMLHTHIQGCSSDCDGFLTVDQTLTVIALQQCWQSSQP